jgi:uncharacterized membrane protein
MNRLHRIGAVAMLLAGLGVTGCAVDQTTGKRTATGAATGAAAGAVVGLFTGNWLGSAGVGALSGATSGFVYDQIQKAD